MATPAGANATGGAAATDNGTDSLRSRGDGQRGRGRGRGNRGRGRGDGSARGGAGAVRGRGRGHSNAAPAPETSGTPSQRPKDALLRPPEAKPKTDDSEQSEGDAEGEVCFICANPIIHHSIAPCNHITCHICSLRMRALYKTKDCPHCRVSTPPALPFDPVTDDRAPDCRPLCHLYRRPREAIRGVR